MDLAVESIVDGIIRASIGLSLAAFGIGLLSRAFKLQSPRLEQWAWGFVLLQGVIVTRLTLSIPLPWTNPAATLTHNIPLMQNESINLIIDTQSVAVNPDSPAAPSTLSETQPAIDGRIPSNFHREPMITATATHIALSWQRFVLFGWLTGIGLLVGVGSLRYAMFIRRIGQSGDVPDEWLHEWNAVCEQMHVTKIIPLVITEQIGPALVRIPGGYCLVVPRKHWEHLSSAQRWSILRHEASHVLRGDIWTALIARLIGLIHWFNPFAWWAVKRFETQSELICDRIAAGDEPTVFVEALLKLGSARSRQILATQAVNNGTLTNRVKQLLSDAPNDSRWKRIAVVAVAVIALLPAAIQVQGVTYATQHEPQSNKLALRDESIATASKQEVAAVKRAKQLLKLGTDDLRTSHHINDMTFSRDGKFIAAAPANTPHAEVELFDVATGKSIKLIQYTKEKSSWIDSLDISYDDSKLLWGEVTGYVALWDLKTDRLIFREKLHRGRINEVTFSYWGNMFASVGDDGIVHLRQTGDPGKPSIVFGTGGEMPQPFGADGFGGETESCLAFTRDDTRLIAGTALKSEISIWQIEDGQLLRRFKVGEDKAGLFAPQITHLEATPDSMSVMSVGIKYVQRKDTNIKHGPKNVQLCQIHFWDIASGTEVSHLHGPEDFGFGLATLSRDGTQVAVADFGRLRVIDANTCAPIREITLPGSWGRQPKFSPDGNTVGMPIENTIGLFDVKTGKRLLHSESTPERGVASAAWSADSRRIVTGHQDGQVRMWNTETGELIWSETLAPVISPSGWNASPRFVSFSDDGKRIVVAGRCDDPIEYKEGIIAVFNAENGTLLQSIRLPEIGGAAFSSVENFLIAASSHGSWDDTHFYGVNLESGKVSYVNPPEDERAAFTQMEAMHFLPRSTTLVTALGNSEVITFDGMTGVEKRRFVADFRPPKEILEKPTKVPQLWNGAFSLDGKTLVSSSAEFVYIWDVDRGVLKRKLRHPHDKGCSVAVSPDGKVIATSDLQYAGDPGVDTIRLYDIDTGELLMTAEPEHNRAGVLSFSPDGRKLLTGYGRGSADIWDISGLR